jgi:hypothetical protein
MSWNTVDPVPLAGGGGTGGPGSGGWFNASWMCRGWFNASWMFGNVEGGIGNPNTGTNWTIVGRS